jgi:hypothetical protein
MVRNSRSVRRGYEHYGGGYSNVSAPARMVDRLKVRHIGNTRFFVKGATYGDEHGNTVQLRDRSTGKLIGEPYLKKTDWKGSKYRDDVRGEVIDEGKYMVLRKFSGKEDDFGKRVMRKQESADEFMSVARRKQKTTRSKKPVTKKPVRKSAPKRKPVMRKCK